MKSTSLFFRLILLSLPFLFVSFTASAAVEGQEVLGEIIAARQVGADITSAGMARADERARTFDEAIAQVLAAYKSEQTPERWANLRAEVERAVVSSVSLHRFVLTQALEQEGSDDELFRILSAQDSRRQAVATLTAGNGYYTRIDRLVVFGADPGKAWKPRKKGASVALFRQLEAGDAAARKSYDRLYRDMLQLQKERFDAIAQELDDLVDDILRDIAR